MQPATGELAKASGPPQLGASIQSQLESLYLLLEVESRKKKGQLAADPSNKQEPLTPAHPHLKLLIKLVFELLSLELSTAQDKYDATWRNIITYAESREQQRSPDWTVTFARDSKTVVSSKEKIVSVIIFKISDQQLGQFVENVHEQAMLNGNYSEVLETLSKFDKLSIPVESKILFSYRDYLDKQKHIGRGGDSHSDPRADNNSKVKITEFTLKEVPPAILTNSEFVHHEDMGRPVADTVPLPKVTLALFESNYQRNKEDWVKPSENLLREKFSRLLQTKPNYTRPDLVAKATPEKKICLGCRKDLDGITRYVAARFI